MVICCFTRFIELIPLPRKDALSVARGLLSVVGRFGRPKEIRSDNGGEFINQVCTELLTLMKIKHDKRVPYRPASNGIVERSIQELTKHFKSLVHELFILEENWIDGLSFIQYIMNNRVHSATGFAPVTLMFGNRITPHRHLLTASPNYDKHPPSSIFLKKLFSLQDTLIEKANFKQSDVIEKRLQKGKVLNYPFVKGDYVLYKPSLRRNKLQSKLLGPYQVTKTEGSHVTIQSLVGEPERQVHPSTLRPYEGNDAQAAANRNHTETYIIEKIISAGAKDDVNELTTRSPNDFVYHVKFEGYKEPEWHTYETVKDSDQLIEYIRSLENPPQALLSLIDA